MISTIVSFLLGVALGVVFHAYLTAKADELKAKVEAQAKEDAVKLADKLKL